MELEESTCLTSGSTTKLQLQRQKYRSIEENKKPRDKSTHLWTPYLWQEGKNIQWIKEIVFSPLYILASFVKDKVSIGAWIYLWAFYFVPLIYISVFVPVPHCLDDCGFVVEPEVRQVDSSSSIRLSQDCFGYLSFIVFPSNCEIICSSSVKNTIGSLIGIALDL